MEVAMRRTREWWSGLLVLILVVPTGSWAHAYLVKSSPARRAVLSNSPSQVVLWFNEQLEAQFSQLSVWNNQGGRLDSGDVQVAADDPKKLSVSLPALPAGTYTVKFRVLSVDGHIAEAEFPFTIRARP